MKIHPGSDVMILKIFSPKNSAKKMAFLTQNKACFCKNCDHNIGFREKRHFLPNIVIITSTPARADRTIASAVKI
jgi:hypothetical protein